MHSIKKYLEKNSPEILYFMEKFDNVKASLEFFKIKEELDLFFTNDEKEYFMKKNGDISIKIKPKKNPSISCFFNYYVDREYFCSTSVSVKHPVRGGYPFQFRYRNSSLSIILQSLKEIHKTKEYDFIKEAELSVFFKHPLFLNFIRKKEDEHSGVFITDLLGSFSLIHLKFESFSFIFNYNVNNKIFQCVYKIEGVENSFNADENTIVRELNNIHEILELFLSY